MMMMMMMMLSKETLVFVAPSFKWRRSFVGPETSRTVRCLPSLPLSFTWDAYVRVVAVALSLPGPVMRYPR
jgi:hypothetical protein